MKETNMHYKKMAKHWIYEKAKVAIPENDTGMYLEIQRPFTDGELIKFLKAIYTELERMRIKLVEKDIIVDG